MQAQAPGQASGRRSCVAWKIRNLKAYTPSIRYRCLFPLLNLRDRGWDTLVLTGKEGVSDWSRLAALVFVKVHEDEDVALARAATAAGVPVFTDLCDNIFADDLTGPKRDRDRENFLKIADLSRFVLVPSPAFRAVLEPLLKDPSKIREIPDQVEEQRQTIDAFEVEDWRSDALGLRQVPLKIQLRRLRTRIKRFWKPKKERDLTDPGPPPPKARDRQRVIWFGTAGKFGRSGMGILADICPELEELNRKVPIELLVVSSSEERFRKEIEPFDFPSLYRPWHPIRIFEDIQSADVFVLPNSQDEFTKTKSANRALLTLSLGVPVVATPISSMEPFADGAFLGHCGEQLHHCLTDRAERERRLANGQAQVEATFSGRVLTDELERLLREAAEPKG